MNYNWRTGGKLFSKKKLLQYDSREIYKFQRLTLLTGSNIFFCNVYINGKKNHAQLWIYYRSARIYLVYSRNFRGCFKTINFEIDWPETHGRRRLLNCQQANVLGYLSNVSKAKARAKSSRDLVSWNNSRCCF